MQSDEISEHTIWELVSTHQNIERLIEDKSDDVKEWARSIVAQLNESFSTIEKVALDGLDLLPLTKTEQEQREFAYELPLSSIILTMRDGGNYAPMIWEMIEPESGHDGVDEMNQAIELLELVVKMDGYRWPEITSFLERTRQTK